MKEFNPGYDQYIHSPEWKEKRNQRLELDHHKCCVCGREATEVHHLTYEHMRNEPMDDLVSLCHQCHEKAEEIYTMPWVMLTGKTDGMNFMAAMRVDAQKLSQIVFDYLMDVRGQDFDSLMVLRQNEGDSHEYWTVLRKAVKALCQKRYSKCVADRLDIVMTSISNRAESICVSAIEHNNRNMVQNSLWHIVNEYHEQGFKWNQVAEFLHIRKGTLEKLKKDDGTSNGPSLREIVMYYCGLDAAAGIRPLEGFECLTDEDYETLNQFADYEANVSGDGVFKGEFMKSTIQEDIA